MIVTIIIPVYNVEKYIERCLLSVVKQTYSNIEIIFVNDCTPDNSMQVVDSYLLNNPNDGRIKIVAHDVNKGLSEARNSGINVAKGEYLYFLDSDDEITIDCIETLVENCQGEDFVIGGVMKNDGSLFFLNKEGGMKKQEIINAYLNYEITDIACNKLVKKDFVIQNKLFFKPGLLHEDFLWSYKCCMVASSICVLEKVTYVYHFITNSISNNFGLLNFRNLEEIYHEIKNDILFKRMDKNLLVNKFLLNFIFSAKTRAVKSNKIMYDDFKKSNFEILKFEYQNLNLTLKYFLLKLPPIFQYVSIKLWYR